MEPRHPAVGVPPKVPGVRPGLCQPVPPKFPWVPAGLGVVRCPLPGAGKGLLPPPGVFALAGRAVAYSLAGDNYERD